MPVGDWIFESELENFPLTTYKDQVDAFVHALAGNFAGGTPSEPAMMELYAALNTDRRAEARALVEYVLIEQEWQSEWKGLDF